MRKKARNLVLLLLLPLLCSCPGYVDPRPESEYSPILMSRDQLETSILKKEPRTISNPGKIYRYGNYILINEQYKGVHVINNTDPKVPVNIGFIQVPGCVDMAVKSNVLYVDNAVDLVAIDISDFNDIKVAKRLRNTIPALLPPDNMGAWFDMAGAPADAIIVDWELKQPE